MTERYQCMGSLRRHDTCNARGTDDIALLGITLLHDCERRLAHHHATFGDRDPLGWGFLRDIDHARLAAPAQMRQPAAFHWAGVAVSTRVMSARVAAATSGRRIRLSPMRNVEIPQAASRARSAGVLNPLSPTIILPRGTRGARRSLVARLVSKVLKLRLLMPIRRDLSASARSSSRSS